MSKQKPCGVVTLLTDFGLKDPFVGVMKGVILTRFPEARIVDLCHGIRAQDLVEASFWMEHSYAWFPEGTVHVAVVDPGVGSARGTLAIRADGHYFIGPDNGLFSGVLARAEDVEVRDIDIDGLGLPEPSRTFHGRDVFAPAAAELASRNVAFHDIGAETAPEISLDIPLPRRTEGLVQGRVITIDRFGNLITNIDQSLLSDFDEAWVSVGKIERRLCATYAEAEPGEYVGVINSFGTLELARRDSSAAQALGVGPGFEVSVRRAPSSRRSKT